MVRSVHVCTVFPTIRLVRDAERDWLGRTAWPCLVKEGQPGPLGPMGHYEWVPMVNGSF